MFDNSTNTTQCLYIPIINDECVESESEEFTATLYTDDDCVSFGTNSTTISIFDDDCECSYYFLVLVPAKEQQVVLYNCWICIKQYCIAMASWIVCLTHKHLSFQVSFCRCYNWFAARRHHSEWRCRICTGVCGDKVWLCTTRCWSQLECTRWHWPM